MADYRKISYVYSKKLENATDNIANIKSRGAIIHSLIESYDLLKKCQLIESLDASEEDLLSFHSAKYIEYLKSVQDISDLEKAAENTETVEYNLEYDCPLFEYMFNFAKVIAGGSLSAVRYICPREIPTENAIICENSKPRSYLKHSKLKCKKAPYEKPADIESQESDKATKRQRLIKNYQNSRCKSHHYISINWFGGWHHAQRDAAEGFCYVNDIVIGIQSLLKFYSRVLYVDLDVHHGNGVENAFAHTPHVLTVSFHKHALGYYPGTGSENDVGIGPGMYYSVNVPLKDGITDTPYTSLFSQVMSKIKEVYNPDCVVLQCGADSLSGDPLGGFNLSLQAYGFCVNYLLDWRLPTTLLGGGGYNKANAARCYAYLTSIVTGCPISTSIPENDFFHLFGPDFELDVTPSLRKDENSDSYLKSILATVMVNLNQICVK